MCLGLGSPVPGPQRGVPLRTRCRFTSDRPCCELGEVSEGRAPGLADRTSCWLLEHRSRFLRTNRVLLLQHELPRARLGPLENGENKLEQCVSSRKLLSPCLHWNLNATSTCQRGQVSREEQRQHVKDNTGVWTDSECVSTGRVRRRAAPHGELAPPGKSGLRVLMRACFLPPSVPQAGW